MALFKRKRDDAPETLLPSDGPEPSADADVPEAEDPTPAPEPARVPDAEAPESVGISVSSLGGFGATAQPAPSAPAPAPAAAATPPAETVPGLRDNVLLRTALAALPDSPSSIDLVKATRQLLQGHVFLRVKGDARALLAEGKQLPLGVVTLEGRQFVLVYSSGAALQASLRQDQVADTSAMGQPVMNVLRHVLAGEYEGIIIDAASAPARAVLRREVLQPMVDEADPELELKTLIAGEQTAATPAAVAEALTRVRFWLAVNTTAEGAVGIAEARATDGTRVLEIYSHPMEVLAMDRGDRPAPMTGAQLADVLRREQAIDGVVVDSAGPWLRLSRDDLAPVLALAD